MISKIYKTNFFAKTFTLGLLLLFANIIKDFFGTLAGVGFPASISTSLAVAGLTICVVSLLFLLIEWLSLPFGMQTKRIKLYQGGGNLIALLMLVGGCFVKQQTGYTPTVFALAVGGLVITLAFSLAGKNIADIISRKRIVLSNREKSFPPHGKNTKNAARDRTKDVSPLPVVQH